MEAFDTEWTAARHHQPDFSKVSAGEFVSFEWMKCRNRNRFFSHLNSISKNSFLFFDLEK